MDNFSVQKKNESLFPAKKRAVDTNVHLLYFNLKPVKAITIYPHLGM